MAKTPVLLPRAKLLIQQQFLHLRMNLLIQKWFCTWMMTSSLTHLWLHTWMHLRVLLSPHSWLTAEAAVSKASDPVRWFCKMTCLMAQNQPKWQFFVTHRLSTTSDKEAHAAAPILRSWVGQALALRLREFAWMHSCQIVGWMLKTSEISPPLPNWVLQFGCASGNILIPISHCSKTVAMISVR